MPIRLQAVESEPKNVEVVTRQACYTIAAAGHASRFGSRAERQAVLEISAVLDINKLGETQKTNLCRVIS